MNKALQAKLKKAYKTKELMPFVHSSYFDNDNFKLNQELYNKGKFEVNIQNEGHSAQIFEPHLHSILTSKNIPIGRTNETFDGTRFQKPYVKGFQKGKEYFVSHYPEKLFFTNPDNYVKSLHVCYFHKEPINRKKGWNFWETHYPINLSDKIAEEYGFFSGVIRELKYMMDSPAGDFINFENRCIVGTGLKPLSNSEEIFAHKYKVATKEAEYRSGEDWLKLKGNKGRIATDFSEIRKQNKKANKAQLRNIIPALEGYKAQQLAINDLHTLENS